MSLADDHDVLLRQFPILGQSGIYLNHAAMGPWPLATAQAVQRFAEENLLRGASDYRRWMQLEDELHQQLARLINAPSVDDIALCKNTSEGLSVVAQGLPWQADDEVVFASCEFPSNRLPWQALSEYGVHTREVELDNDDPESSLIAACNPRTRLLSVSAVQYADGLRMDLPRLAEHCRAHDILLCVDAIQQVGALSLDVQAIDCDFLIADAHKWLLGPEGIALFYSRPQARGQLRLRQHGWRMYDNPFYFERRDWTPPDSARRFEPGSPNMMGVFALAASLRVLEEFGMEAVGERLLRNQRLLREGLAALPGIKIISDPRDERHSGIVTFTLVDANTERRQNRLLQRHRALTKAGVFGALRSGAIRWSPHFYQPEEQMQRAIEQLANC
ncbi:MAG: aminotransferase class V-fold PLP-dependent enzyme [Wenzhouxiangellaceae bacterium]